MALSLRKSLQEIFVFTNGYSATRAIDRGTEYEPTWSLELIRSLQHDRFLDLCVGYFEEKGYRTKLNTQHDKKFIDIWLFKQSYSDTKPFGIIKCWETKAIKVDLIDLGQFTKIVAKNDIPLGVFITLGGFAKQVPRSMDKRIQLIDGKSLLNMIQSLPDIRSQRLLDRIVQ